MWGEWKHSGRRCACAMWPNVGVHVLIADVRIRWATRIGQRPGWPGGRVRNKRAHKERRQADVHHLHRVRGLPCSAHAFVHALMESMPRSRTRRKRKSNGREYNTQLDAREDPLYCQNTQRGAVTRCPWHCSFPAVAAPTLTWPRSACLDAGTSPAARMHATRT